MLGQNLKLENVDMVLMLNEDGMVYDDGVTTRLGENHYIMTTTTGGAANVMGKLEDYLQTEWPELDVYLTSVTDHFATVTIWWT